MGMYGWLRGQETCTLKWMVGAESGKKGMLTWLFVQTNQRGADGNGLFVQKGKEVHVVNGWLAQKPTRHAYGIDGWCRHP